MKNLKALLTTLAAALLAAGMGACSTQGNGRSPGVDLRNRIYIANVTPPSITIVDLNEFSSRAGEVTTIYFNDIASKNQSHLISVSPDGRYIWTSEDISPDAGYVQVVDALSHEIVKTWPVGAGVGNHISHDGRWFFSSSEQTAHRNINVFDIQNQRYLGYIELDGSPHNYDTTHDGVYLYTTNYPAQLLIEFDISGLAEIARTATEDRIGQRLPSERRRVFNTGGASAHGVLVHPNGKYAVVGAYQPTENNPGVPVGGAAFDTFVDLRGGELQAVKVIPGGNHNYEISPDQRYFISSEWNAQDCNEQDYLTNLEAFGNVLLTTPLLRFIDIQTLNSPNPDYEAIKVVKYLDGADLGYGPLSPMSHEIYDPSGQYLFLTTVQLGNHNKGELLVLDGQTFEVKWVFSLPNHPHGLAVPGYGR
ncbi:MAG: hypothetical protein LBQ61_05710 [Spirochaetales bacterium]|jgi:DNA-binding beta-propeller fold protein YncE|nr:hypothetical protein [Spirochaetales bacterium]